MKLKIPFKFDSQYALKQLVDLEGRIIGTDKELSFQEKLALEVMWNFLGCSRDKENPSRQFQ
jgi:hypothetical protein